MHITPDPCRFLWTGRTLRGFSKHHLVISISMLLYETPPHTHFWQKHFPASWFKKTFEYFWWNGQLRPTILLRSWLLLFAYWAAPRSSSRTICYQSKLWRMCSLTDPLFHGSISGPFVAFRLFISKAWNCDYHSRPGPSHALIPACTPNIHIFILLSVFPFFSSSSLMIHSHTHDKHAATHPNTKRAAHSCVRPSL